MRILPHLNVHLDHSLSNEGGAEESPKGNQEVPAGDSSQVEKGVWNAEKVEDRVKRRERGEETLQLPGCQRSRPSPPIAGCHTWLAQTWRVISFHQRSWSVPSFLDIAKKGWQFKRGGRQKNKTSWASISMRFTWNQPHFDPGIFDIPGHFLRILQLFLQLEEFLSVFSRLSA